jgi:hypothetical protein
MTDLVCDLCQRNIDTIGPCVRVATDGTTTLGAQCGRCARYGPPGRYPGPHDHPAGIG